MEFQQYVKWVTSNCSKDDILSCASRRAAIKPLLPNKSRGVPLD